MLARTARSRSATALVLVAAAAVLVTLGRATAQEPAAPPDGPPAVAPAPARPRWEYTFIKPADVAALVAGQAPLVAPETEAEMLAVKQRLYAKLVERFGELGEQGWELCGFEEDLFVFKRPVLDAPAAPGEAEGEKDE